MFSWLSLLSGLPGLISQGFAYLNKRADVNLEKYKVDGQFDMSQIQAHAAVAIARSGDTVDRWGRRLFIYPAGVYFAVTLYYSTFHTILPAYMTWKTLELPPDFKYYMGAVVGYLLVTTWKAR